MASFNRNRLAFPVMLLLLAGAVFASLSWYMGVLERRALGTPAIRDQLVHGRARPLAEVAQTVAKMELVTAEVQTCVSTRVEHDNWRGLAAATVEAPVRLLYGVDVSKVKSESIGYSPATKSYLIRIPPPQRIATEVRGGEEEIEVHVGWARLRSRAGEYYLGLARKGLYDAARELTLGPDDSRNVRETTVAQVQSAVKKLVGEEATVKVVIDDALGGVTTATTGESP